MGRGRFLPSKFGFFGKKWIKSCTSLVWWGIEPGSPAWETDVLTTRPWNHSYQKSSISFYMNNKAPICQLFDSLVWLFITKIKQVQQNIISTINIQLVCIVIMKSWKCLVSKHEQRLQLPLGSDLTNHFLNYLRIFWEIQPQNLFLSESLSQRGRAHHKFWDKIWIFQS